MAELEIIGQRPLNGKVRVNGAKNACLPIMAATIMTEGDTVLYDVPEISNVAKLADLLRALGVSCDSCAPNQMRLRVENEDGGGVCKDGQVREIRASICLLGPLLAKRKHAVMALPGGCGFQNRPIDLHIKGLRELGATIDFENGHILASASRLKGATIYLGGPCGSTVLGTENVMTAATLAEGTTVIEHAACEPEVRDLATFLNACGAHISGAGTGTVTIEGVSHLRGAFHRIIPDRIEAGTFAAAAAITGGDVVLDNVRPDHMVAVTDLLTRMGVSFDVSGTQMRVRREGKLLPVNFSAFPYPGLPTDMQAPLVAALSQAEGTSVVTDRVYCERFTHVGELNRMGANVWCQDSQLIVHGPARLSGAEVKAHNLRCGAAIVVAALAAEGVTRMDGMVHVDRGYARIEAKLAALGADIARKAPAAALTGIRPLRRAAS